MKRNYLIGAMIALLSVACSKEQPEQSVPAEVQGLSVSASVEQPGDGTKTSLDGLNVKWSVGDRIYLTDGTNCAIYEAESAALSTSFKYVSGDVNLEGDVYAYYPAENVSGFNDGTFTATIPSVQPYTAGGFAEGINPMTAKATVSEGSLSLNFKNVMSFVKLQIADDEPDGKILAGLSLSSTAEPEVALCGTATVSVDENGIPTTSIEGTNTVELGDINSSLSSVVFTAFVAVPVGDLGHLKITAKTTESTGLYSQVKVASNDLVAERSSINSYNPILISKFSEKTAEPEYPANCYMIDASKRNFIVIPLAQALDGWNAIKALEPDDEFDTAKITTGERTIAVRWLDGEGGSISLSSINTGSMTLALDCANGTNAVVDLKNGDEIVWSWHLWFTDYKPAWDQANTLNGQVHAYANSFFQEGGRYYGKVMMDRNLGATAIGVDGAITQPTSDIEARSFYGLYYQFGRKDPFTVSHKSHSVVETKVKYSYAVHNPDLYLSSKANNLGWSITDSDAASNTDPWASSSNEKKSAFDPCPAGWRVPSVFVYSGINVENYCGEGTYTRGFQWCGAWIPAQGDLTAAGSHECQGTHAKFWSCAPRGKMAGTIISINSEKIVYGAGNGNRAYGLCIRCVKE